MDQENDSLAWSEKVVWQEGMTLDPHHFQQSDRHHHALLSARIRSVTPFYWGLNQVTIDMDRLVNGEFALLDCAGIMPDGLAFEISGSLGNVPDTRNIDKYEKFPPSKETLNIYLAVPSVFKDGANVRLPEGLANRPIRYRTHTISMSDETTGENERPVDVARANFKILLEGESMQGYSIMHIAQVARSGGNSFKLSPRFAPTCLYIKSSEYLINLTSRILQNLVTHSTKVRKRASSIFSQRETTPDDVLVFGRQGVVNGNIPIIKHFYEQSTSHPEALFLALTSLAAQLYTYISNASVAPNEYPVYNHNNLSHCFNRLEEILAELIHDEAPQSIYSMLELAMLRDNVYSTSIERSLEQHARLYVVARSGQIPEHQLIAELPTIVRVASPGSIDMVVQAAVPGLGVSHTSRLPASVPIDDRASYFELQKNGHFWDAIKDEKAVAIFLPYNRSQVEIQLLSVNTSG